MTGSDKPRRRGDRRKGALRFGPRRGDRLLRCLDVLLKRGKASPGFLATAVGLTPGSVTTMLDRLEALGYVQRAPDPSDRRKVEVRPTAAAIDADLELFVDFLQRDRPRQEAHANRIRGLPPRTA